MIDPLAEENGMVYYGNSGENIKAIYGIDSIEFIKIHQRLVKRGLITEFPDAYIQIQFALYSNELINMGFDLSNLLSEFNSAQKNNFHELNHALSLTKLCYHYHKAGFNIEVVKTQSNQSTPDLIIDEVTCDLKVRHDQTNEIMQRHRDLLSSGKEQEYYDIYFNSIRSLQKDLMSALENRASKQAECLIFDLSNYFHTWNYYRIESYLQNKTIDGVSRKPIKAIPGVCIIFSPDNAKNLQTRIFTPKAFWGYVLYDAQKRELINTHNSSKPKF